MLSGGTSLIKLDRLSLLLVTYLDAKTKEDHMGVSG